MSEGAQYIGMTVEQIAAHDFKCEHGFAKPEPRGEFSIGGKLWPGLSKLIEECGEVLQVGGKLIGSEGRLDHWSGDLGVMLVEELGDLMGAMQFFIDANRLDAEAVKNRAAEKYHRFEGWHRDTLAARLKKGSDRAD